jgi:hypothetical protein
VLRGESGSDHRDTDPRDPLTRRPVRDASVVDRDSQPAPLESPRNARPPLPTGRREPLLALAFAAALVSAPRAASAQTFAERFVLRAEVGAGTMPAGYQRDTLGDGLDVQASGRLGFTLFGPVALQASFSDWWFPSSGAAGGRPDGRQYSVTGGLRIEPMLGSVGRLFLDGNAGLGVTGGDDRLAVDAGLGFEFALGRAIGLGPVARFTILAGSTVSNTGLTTIVGEVGVFPGAALVGIPAGTVVHAADPVAALAQADTTVAYNRLAGLPCGTTLTARDLGGMTLAPGVYCFTSSAMLTGTLFLDGRGQTDPLFIFQIGSTLVISNVAAVVMTNGARSCGVYWQTGSSATVGIGSRFAGNILALGSVTLTTGVALAGRALARNGGVTLDTNSVSNAACPDPAPPADAGVMDAGPADAPADALADRPDGG